eukprot:CAMPEP_0119379328 /NCGR_PEP_ID=MMETSP1334-20130426/52212_1 /TAXON_ID=127549 /ORGANISM="Calcidiscus leptoporus, Strain RCC1130" /LENGTH=232 /DNA_ID=CAMNT_0007398807 /DNA_START=187 /DNA_END=885 /DNA_ORIENTATION=-
MFSESIRTRLESFRFRASSSQALQPARLNLAAQPGAWRRVRYAQQALLSAPPLHVKDSGGGNGSIKFSILIVWIRVQARVSVDARERAELLCESAPLTSAMAVVASDDESTLHHAWRKQVTHLDLEAAPALRAIDTSRQSKGAERQHIADVDDRRPSFGTPLSPPSSTSVHASVSRTGSLSAEKQASQWSSLRSSRKGSAAPDARHAATVLTLVADITRSNTKVATSDPSSW